MTNTLHEILYHWALPIGAWEACIFTTYAIARLLRLRDTKRARPTIRERIAYDNMANLTDDRLYTRRLR
jgi:hypothetical protein